jgi:tRNA (guanine-N7-)-methyltransferase
LTLVTTRTFNARRGRLSGQRLGALARLGPEFGVTVGAGPVDPVALYGRRAPLVLEIGSGMGDATAELARADPDRDYLAVEVHTAGVADLLALVAQRGLTNVRVAAGDAIALLTDQLAPASLDAVHVFFPDPWPKARHHKRRLIEPDRVSLLASRLVPGGILHCATDSAGYAEHMLATLSACVALRNRYPGGVPRPDWRPVTMYERRAVAAGRSIVDLSFERSSTVDAAG